VKLFEVYNGWMGESVVRVLVVADSEAQALNIAREKYKQVAEAEDRKELRRLETLCAELQAKGKQQLYGERYYNDLSAKVIFDDLTAPACTEPSDG